MPVETTILDLSFEECLSYLQSIGEKPFRARQIFEWIYHKGIFDFDRMKNLPLNLRQRLKADHPFSAFSFSSDQAGPTDTKKYLFKLNDGQAVETVVIPAAHRLTVCVSSQVGCKFACQFCASGIGGWIRNLTCGEILMQILHAQSQAKQKATHIVFMGMGEPFDNWEAVRKAIETINSSEGLDIAARRITVSTCGIIPGLADLADLGKQVELSVSLHGHDDTIRAQLMPVNRRYPLKDLIAACQVYIERTNRQITFEYILIDGLTCHDEAAWSLGRMLKGMLCKVNLIPYNLVEEFDWKAPSRSAVYQFRDALLAYGVHATIRWSKGQYAHGACGQLRSRMF